MSANGLGKQKIAAKEQILGCFSYSIDAVGTVKLEVLIKYVQDQPVELLRKVTERTKAEF